MFGLTKEEERILHRLNTPHKIQDFLDTLPINYEKKGDTCFSPRRVLKEQKAHCLEGAMLAATALWLHGKKPLLMDLRTTPNDDPHTVVLYKTNGYWGAISKTNHAVLRFRDPIYRTLRELALSYFHEYFLSTTGTKTLREYSIPLDLSTLGDYWVTASHELFEMSDTLDSLRHFPLIPKKNRRAIRNATPIEISAGDIIEWKKSNPRT